MEVGARGVVSDSLIAFLKFMGLSRKKARLEADRIGRISLQASYTLWLSRNEQKFSRWTLVEPQITVNAPATQHEDRGVPNVNSTRSPADEKQMSTRLPENLQKTRNKGAISQQHCRIPKGLVNLGNTCFINSIAQCLMANVSLCTVASPALVKALENIKSTRGQTIRPTGLVRAVSLLNPSLTSGQQQDAVEALEVVLSPDTLSPTQDYGEVAEVITCTVCGSESGDSRPLAPPILRVPITAQSLEGCVANMLAPQALDGRRCSQCQALSSEISTKILAYPQALAIQLLRFEQQGSLVVKNTSSVALSPTIRLNSTTWRITGIINHIGSAQGGHYSAYTQRSLRWFQCDDSRVAKTSVEAAFSSSEKSAYLLFLDKC